MITGQDLILIKNTYLLLSYCKFLALNFFADILDIAYLCKRVFDLLNGMQKILAL
jgi:hypothetical protein